MSWKIIVYTICIISLFIIIPSCSKNEAFQDDFQSGIGSQWSAKTPEKWGSAKEGNNSFCCLKEPGQPDQGIRRPTEYLLLENYTFGDFDFKCRVRCDAPVDARYRDVVIIFGYKDDSHFYYVQFSNISDDLHNTIMLVDGDSRTRVSKDIHEPTLIDQDFHNVEVKREKSKIEVYFNSELIMQAEDDKFQFGKLGIGSFDDIASFDDVQVLGRVISDL